MATPNFIATPAGQAPVVAKTEVVVVGGGPAGVSAAVSAGRNGASVTLVERYPYLGGLASGGMVLVLDDMHNDTEISVRGLCMELIDRMHAKGFCVYPPEPARHPDNRLKEAVRQQWNRWGVFDFHTHTKPHPIIFAAAFDPDGFKQGSLDMVGEATKAGVLDRVHFSDSVCRGRDYYTPYRALMPREVDQILVAGRHYSVTPSAQKLSREIPPCMAQGEAVGSAAALAANAGVTVREVDPRAIQKQMRAQGADPGDIPSTNARVTEAA
jgi:hypothetical protein